MLLIKSRGVSDKVDTRNRKRSDDAGKSKFESITRPLGNKNLPEETGDYLIGEPEEISMKYA